MRNIVSHLTEQGVQVYAALQKPKDVLDVEMAWWAVVLFALHIIPYSLFSTMVNYTYGEVVEALAIVESPSYVSLQSLARQDSEEMAKEKSPRKVLRKQPITTSFKTTIRHLHAHAGHFSCFRGASIWCIHGILHSNLSALFRLFFIRHGLDTILATICLSTIQMTWTHIVISQPTTEFWFERLPSRKNWRKLAIPTAVFACAKHATIGLPTIIFALHIDKLDADTLSNMSYHDRSFLILKLFCMVILSLFLGVTIFLPSKVILTRVYASLLPNTVETIVPFDRTFGGRFLPNGANTISMVEAWKTFGGQSRLNLFMVYLKILLIQGLLKAASYALQTIQLHLILGVELSKISFLLLI